MIKLVLLHDDGRKTYIEGDSFIEAQQNNLDKINGKGVLEIIDIDFEDTYYFSNFEKCWVRIAGEVKHINPSIDYRPFDVVLWKPKNLTGLVYSNDGIRVHVGFDISSNREIYPCKYSDLELVSRLKETDEIKN